MKNPGSDRKDVVQAKPSRHQMPHITAVPCIADGVGEDEASHDRHVKILSLEWKKHKPNKHAISELMRRTFVVRRQRILSSPVAVDSLLGSYPPLRQYGEVRGICIPLFVYLLHLQIVFIACFRTGQNSWQECIPRNQGMLGTASA